MSALSQFGRDWAIGVVVATEVPPPGTSELNSSQVALAIRAVCGVIRNRVANAAFPNDPVLVVLQQNQFSAVCREDYWRKAMAGQWFPQHVEACVAAWQTPETPPLVGNATHYYSPISMIPKGRVPGWAAQMHEVLVPGLPTEFFRFFAP